MSASLVPRSASSAGEAHALVGENGAGKSTLIKILAGVHQPDAGRIAIDGTPIEVHGPAHARRLGIAVIHQEPSLFPDLSVAENVFLGHLPMGRFGVDWRRARRQAAEIFDELDVWIAADAPVRGLSMADQQLVEIAKALSLDARVLIMDEPTASLSLHEVERLFSIVRPLRDRALAVLFVSYRLEEAFQLCQRNGAPRRQARHYGDGRPAHEIVGFAGLIGAGRTEIARVLFGVERAHSGEIRLHGKHVEFNSPAAALRAGVAYIPEDRHQQGLVLDFPITSNVSLPTPPRLFPNLFVHRQAERELSERYARQLHVRMTDVEQLVASLFGGNQHKVVIAKWLATQPRVLILDEPTRGIDIGAKIEVHRIVAELAAAGLGIVLISSDLPEVLAMSDRILARTRGFVDGDLTTQQVVSAIAVSAANPDAIAPALRAARSAGIKVVGYDSSPAEGAYDVFVNIGQALVQMACVW